MSLHSFSFNAMLSQAQPLNAKYANQSMLWSICIANGVNDE